MQQIFRQLFLSLSNRSAQANKCARMCIHTNTHIHENVCQAHTQLCHIYIKERKVPIIRYGQEGGGQYPFLCVETKK